MVMTSCVVVLVVFVDVFSGLALYRQLLVCDFTTRLVTFLAQPLPYYIKMHLLDPVKCLLSLEVDTRAVPPQNGLDCIKNTCCNGQGTRKQGWVILLMDSCSGFCKFQLLGDMLLDMLVLFMGSYKPHEGLYSFCSIVE